MMTEINECSDANDSSSNITKKSEEVDIGCSEAQTQSRNTITVPRFNHNNLHLPTFPDTPLISHISSIALQHTTDKCYANSGSIIVNQYSYERPTTTNLGKKIVPFCTLWKHLLAIVIVIITVSALALVTTILIFDFKNGKTDTGIIDIDNDNTALRLMSREEWRAKPVTGHIDDLITPVPLVIVQHTVQPSCDTMETCTTLVRQVQILHKNSENIKNDVGYNFLIGGDGAAYEGRGWDKIGAHTRGYNSRSIGIAFIGDFRQESPTDQQIVALLTLLRDGVKMKKLAENYTLLGANQVRQTESPGKMLFRILTKLPHWSEQID